MNNYRNYVLITIFTSVFAAEKLPAYIKICHRSDPNLNDCVKSSIENLKPLLAKGIPEFNIPSCEPLRIPEVTIDQGTGPVSVKSTYRDIKVYGPSKFVLKQIRLNLDRNRILIKLWLPKLELVSKYAMEGRILMMPISGDGLSKGNYCEGKYLKFQSVIEFLANIDATILIQGQRIKKNNETYFHIRNFFVDFNIGHATIQLDDLFHGDRELGDALNLFLNENWRNIASEIKPVLEDTIAGIFKKFSNKIYHKYPLDLLLPK